MGITLSCAELLIDSFSGNRRENEAYFCCMSFFRMTLLKSIQNQNFTIEGMNKWMKQQAHLESISLFR